MSLYSYDVAVTFDYRPPRIAGKPWKPFAATPGPVIFWRRRRWFHRPAR